MYVGAVPFSAVNVTGRIRQISNRIDSADLRPGLSSQTALPLKQSFLIRNKSIQAVFTALRCGIGLRAFELYFDSVLGAHGLH